MTIDDALRQLQSQLNEDKSLPKELALEICSGGERKKDKEHSYPALYADQEDAIKLWYEAVWDRAPMDAVSYRFVEAPTLNKYQITMQDARGTHRVTADRYVVTSKIVFGEATNG